MKERGGARGVDEVPGTEIASAVDVVGWSAPKALPNPVTSAKAKTWNTRHLGWRIGADAISAASAGVLVAPIINVIDR